MIGDMLEHGVIEKSRSLWASPIVLVPKKDGGIRLCIDYRKVNAATRKEVYPFPRADDTLDMLRGARVFSKIDCAAGYWQVPMHSADKAETAFVTSDGQYQFNVMPFGLVNAPATFQRMMDAILAGIKWTFCMVYFDDIIIFSPDMLTHLRHQDEVFRRLAEARITLKLSKCVVQATTTSNTKTSTYKVAGRGAPAICGTNTVELIYRGSLVLSISPRRLSAYYTTSYSLSISNTH